MLDNHYKKLKQSFNNRMATPLEGIVYQCMPEERILTKADLTRLVTKRLLGHKEEELAKVSVKDIEAAIDGLVERKFLKLLIGVILERAVEKL